MARRVDRRRDALRARRGPAAALLRHAVVAGAAPADGVRRAAGGAAAAASGPAPPAAGAGQAQGPEAAQAAPHTRRQHGVARVPAAERDEHGPGGQRAVLTGDVPRRAACSPAAGCHGPRHRAGGGAAYPPAAAHVGADRLAAGAHRATAAVLAGTKAGGGDGLLPSEPRRRLPAGDTAGAERRAHQAAARLLLAAPHAPAGHLNPPRGGRVTRPGPQHGRAGARRPACLAADDGLHAAPPLRRPTAAPLAAQPSGGAGRPGGCAPRKSNRLGESAATEFGVALIGARGDMRRAGVDSDDKPAVGRYGQTGRHDRLATGRAELPR